MNHEESEAAASRAIVPVPDGRTRSIVVNGREHRHAGDRIERRELARLAYPQLTEARGRSLTIAYRDGPKTSPRGIVAHGGSVEIADGQAFNVSLTDKS